MSWLDDVVMATLHNNRVVTRIRLYGTRVIPLAIQRHLHKPLKKYTQAKPLLTVKAISAALGRGCNNRQRGLFKAGSGWFCSIIH